MLLSEEQRGAMREVVGRTPIQPALTEARAQIEQSVRQGAQFILDQYGSGIEITQIQLLKVDPPPAVIDAFRDVQRANADRERARNEAEAYRNDIIPRARGEAERRIQEAQGFRDRAACAFHDILEFAPLFPSSQSGQCGGEIVTAKGLKLQFSAARADGGKEPARLM